MVLPILSAFMVVILSIITEVVLVKVSVFRYVNRYESVLIG